MAGTGTGCPITFRCAKCRMTCNRSIDDVCRDRPGPRGWVDRVTLTGRSRPYKLRSGPRRMQPIAVEYVCRDCGHTGWSAHSNIVARFRRAHPEEAS